MRKATHHNQAAKASQRRSLVRSIGEGVQSRKKKEKSEESLLPVGSHAVDLLAGDAGSGDVAGTGGAGINQGALAEQPPGDTKNVLPLAGNDGSGMPDGSSNSLSVQEQLSTGLPEKEENGIEENVKEHPDTITRTNKNAGEKDSFFEFNFLKREEIAPEVQEHLKKEFEVYAVHQLIMIDNGTDIVSPDQKKQKSQTEKREDFLDKKEKFLKRMQGRKRSFWGTKRYTRLMNKWFADYDQVIANKVSLVKTGINDAVVDANKAISGVIDQMNEAIRVVDTDTGKAMQLLEDAKLQLSKASEQKQKALTTLGEYGKDQVQDYTQCYDGVLEKYNAVIVSLLLNVDGVQKDKTRFAGVISQLTVQQELLNQFNTKAAEVTDVLTLISLQENEFVVLLKQTDATIAELKQVGRSTAAMNETAVVAELDTAGKDISTLDAEVEQIKQKEIEHREEERRKKEAEAKRKREEADRLKQEELKKKNEKEDDVPAIFTKDNTVKKTSTIGSANTSLKQPQAPADILKSRGGSDYTKTDWSYKGVAKTAQSTIDESKFSDTDKAFFVRYKKTCDDYLDNYYKTKKNTGHKLTGDMYVNAAKRIYIKYGHLSYIVPAELALVQGNTETNLNTSGAKGYNNPYNVGETDKGAKSWVKEMTSPEIGIFFYMDLLAHDYLSDKTADQLVNNYVNEHGYRFATSPHYEMELKAGIGQVALVRDNKRPAVAVGKTHEKNDVSESAVFVRGMLNQLGYKNAKLGDAITAFQEEKMFPPLTPAQQKNVKNMNDGDRRNFYIKEEKGVDGIAGTRGQTVGLLYYLTYMNNSSMGLADTGGVTTVTTVVEGTTQVKELYKKYANEDITMVDLGKGLVPYCKYFGADVLGVFNKLDWSTEDNLAYALATHATDVELSHFDPKLLKRMEAALDPADNWSSVEQKKNEWERVKKAQGGTVKTAVVAGASVEKDTKTDTKNTNSTKNTKRTSIAVDFKISASVGAGGENVAEDVKKIQDLLVNFNYLPQGNSEINLVAQMIKDKPGTKLKDTQLPNTIAAIKQFQKYGATTGASLSKQDGKVDKSGGTITAMKELNRVDVNYKDQKFEEDIPDVLTKSQWVSQFRFGYNFKDGQDDLEQKYAEFVKKETGLADPADLGTASEDKITRVKNEYAEKKYNWFEQKETLADHGLKMSQKARPYKPNYVCCWDAANTMLGFSGASEKGNSFKIQTYVADLVSYTVNGKTEKKVENGKFTNQLPIGIKYIDGQLKAGHAVFIGVERGAAKTQNESVTDHYIILVGKHKDDSGNYYYSFFDPGTANKGYDTKKNRLKIAADKTSVENSSYKLSQIRTNNE